MAGPLKGIRVVECTGPGPGAFAAMLLSDMGADVIRIERKVENESGELPVGRLPTKFEITLRGRRAVSLDLKKSVAIRAMLKLVAQADVLIEGFRPGVMERLGLGPDTCFEHNPRLVYGRMTGWGQTGPLAGNAGHDINYIALAGALHGIGRSNSGPVPPLNLVGDYGGGALYLVFGIVCGILESRSSGLCQIVDAAMVDGAASLMTVFHGMMAAGSWRDERGVNLLDSGAHFYNTYETSDGKWVALGAIEPKFYGELLKKLQISDPAFDAEMDRQAWPLLRSKTAAIIKSKTRAEWDSILVGQNVCYAPVLSLAEAPEHPHNVARGTFVTIDGIVQPAPAPRFSRTQPEAPGPPQEVDAEGALSRWGFSRPEIDALRSEGAV